MGLIRLHFYADGFATNTVKIKVINLSKAAKYDLTGGPIFKRMVFLSVPLMATSFMQMAYNLTDMFWMGRLSSGSVAAVGTAGQFLWLSMALMIIGRMGAEIGVSQNVGKGNIDAAKAFAQNATYIALILGILYAVVMIFARGILISFFNIDDAAVVYEAEIYLMISAFSIPFVMLHNVISGTFNGFGNTKLPFYINAFGLALNIIISPMLIFWAGMGIAGAALGTVIASIVNLILKLWAIKYFKSRPFENYAFLIRPSLEKIKQIAQWGVPVAIESAFFTFLFMVVSRLIADFSVGAIAAHRVGYQVEALSFMIGGGFAMAVTSFVGQNYGAKKYSRLRDGFKISALAMAVYGLFITLILYFFAEPLVSIFLNDPAEIVMGGDYLRIIALTQFLFCIEGVATGYFRGRGLTMKPTIVGITSNVLRVIFTYTLARTALGISGVWIGIAMAMTIKSIWLIAWHFFNVRTMPKTDELVAQADA